MARRNHLGDKLEMVTFVVARNGKMSVANIIAAMDVETKTYGRYFLRRGGKPWRIDGRKQRRGFVPSLTGIVIRWACAVSLPGIPTLEIQSPQGILNASNKPKARMLLAQAGVPIPKTTLSRYEAQGWVDAGKTLVVRPKKHHAGQGFTVVRPGETVPRGGYYSELYRKTKEFRVHVGHGRVLSCQQKVCEGELPPDRPWNHATGDFIFKVLKWREFRMDVCMTAIKATEVLGLDYAAVDILADEPGNLMTAAVTEVNTSPALADYMVSKYAAYFTAVIGGLEKRPADEPASSWRDIVFRS